MQENVLIKACEAIAARHNDDHANQAASREKAAAKEAATIDVSNPLVRACERVGKRMLASGGA